MGTGADILFAIPVNTGRLNGLAAAAAAWWGEHTSSSSTGWNQEVYVDYLQPHFLAKATNNPNRVIVVGPNDPFFGEIARTMEVGIKVETNGHYMTIEPATLEVCVVGRGAGPVRIYPLPDTD